MYKKIQGWKYQRYDVNKERLRKQMLCIAAKTFLLIALIGKCAFFLSLIRRNSLLVIVTFFLLRRSFLVCYVINVILPT